MKSILLASAAILVMSQSLAGAQNFQDSATSFATRGRSIEQAIANAAKPIRDYDLNGDGLDEGDLAAFSSIRRAQQGAQRVSQLLAADINLDGAVTRREWETFERVKLRGQGNYRSNIDFDSYDRNSDGTVTPAEIMGYQDPMMRNPADQNPVLNSQTAGLFQMDSNSDGKVTIDEVKSEIEKAFEKLDRDGDGYLDGEELRSAVNGMQSQQSRPPASSSSTAGGGSLQVSLLSELASVQQAVRSLMGGQTSYSGISSGLLVGSRAVPSRMIQDGQLVSSLHSPIEVRAAEIDGRHVFSVTFHNLPPDICAQLLRVDLGRGLHSIRAGGMKKSGGELPMLPSDATKMCAAASGQVEWIFR